jgi:hypothetical protein
VSFYEHCRLHDPEPLDVLALLKSGEIKTGTIKGRGSEEVNQQAIIEINRDRNAHSIAEPAGFPTNKKPYPQCKYSHLSDAKREYPLGVSEYDLAITATMRTLSPMNIFLTHTARGNARLTHRHLLDGQRVGDLGEESKVRIYFLAALVGHIEGVDGGRNVAREFMNLAKFKDDVVDAVFKKETLEMARSFEVEIIGISPEVTGI